VVTFDEKHCKIDILTTVLDELEGSMLMTAHGSVWNVLKPKCVACSSVECIPGIEEHPAK
jgi:hypothetical protein